MVAQRCESKLCESIGLPLCGGGSLCFICILRVTSVAAAVVCRTAACAAPPTSASSATAALGATAASANGGGGDVELLV